MLTFYTTDDGKCNPETSIVLILVWIKMANFKSVVLFLKIISLFIVQRSFDCHAMLQHLCWTCYIPIVAIFQVGGKNFKNNEIDQVFSLGVVTAIKETEKKFSKYFITVIFETSEAANWGVLEKMVFLKISQNSHEIYSHPNI